MYWKTPLNVPAGIRYISQWNEFSLLNYPGHNIIHKQLPGCGFTEYALTSNIPVVLCSPRKMLMENKKEQHGNDVYLVVSKFDRTIEVDIDLNKKPGESREKVLSDEESKKLYLESLRERKEEEKSFYSTLFQEIGNYISYITSKRKFPKIIVTYDSAYLISQVLKQMGIIDNFWFVVDEFQSLMEDARFKADTEQEFLSSTLQTIPNVTYVSATPLLDKYIKQIPELNLPYYEMDWEYYDKSRIKKPNLKVRTMKSVPSKMEEIIQSYLNKDYERVVIRDKTGSLKELVSDEAVLYVNSVNLIINIIKKMGLTPDQVNILCSDTPDNRKRVKTKLGKEYEIGKVPLKGEYHKPFTFCTRTVYLGADFYSLCARSFIFSDANSDCLSVDISMDLAQILGRQRLLENPWHNSAEFYYKTTADYKKMTWQQLISILSKKDKETLNLIESWESGNLSQKSALANVYQREARREKYKNNYVSVNRLEDGSLVPVKNNLVRINEERSFDIQQVDYCNRFSVFCSIEDEFGKLFGSEEFELNNFFTQYDSLGTYVEKIRFITDYLLDNPNLYDSIINNLNITDKIRQQIISIGPERIKGLGYNMTKIDKAMGITIFDRSTFDSTILSEFIVGQRYTKKYIKEKLGEIYKAADFKETPKANQLEAWFEIKEVRITIGCKREPGFEILSRK